MSGREILFEFQRVGAYVKVTAVDAETGTEVSIVGAANAPEAVLKQQAINRLRFVMEKRQQNPGGRGIQA
jgi:hypothetical protein